MVQPMQSVCGGHAEKVTVAEAIIYRVRIVIAVARIRVVKIYRVGLINDYPCRFVVRNINDFGICGLNFNDAFGPTYDLVFIAPQVAGGIGLVTKLGNRGQHVSLLVEKRFSQRPRPVQILIHHVDDFRIIE